MFSTIYHPIKKAGWHVQAVANVHRRPDRTETVAASHGAVRGADALRRLNFAVFALGTSPARATGSFAAARGSTLAIRDVLFEPGDFVAMDSDGVVIVTTDTAERAALSGA